LAPRRHEADDDDVCLKKGRRKEMKMFEKTKSCNSNLAENHEIMGHIFCSIVES
jgi:hypothetical protein